MAKSTSGQNLPSTSRQPSQNVPSTSRQPSQNVPSTSRQPSQNVPSTSRQPSHETIYLETHTWHAEYFHMLDKWRHKVPYSSNDKSLNLKASYKALTKNCLLQDISYYICIEIVGEKDRLEATLKEHCDPKKNFAARLYINNPKEGMVMFYKKNGYPELPIGNVNFFWKLSKTDIKTIWIWVHPSFYSDFLSEIITSFEFKQNDTEQDRTDISHNLNDLYKNDAGCRMRVLKYALNRFRLSGPAALTVLKEALYVPSLTELDSENYPMTEEESLLCDEELLPSPDSNDGELDTATDSDVSEQLVEKMVIDKNETDTKDLTIQDPKEKIWPTKYYKERENMETLKIQMLMWQMMKNSRSPSFLLSNMITGLTVLDPRFYLPARRTKPEIPSSKIEPLPYHLPSDLNRSPIWDAQIRQIVSNSFVSTNIIEKLIRQPITSIGQYFDKDAKAKIPILLVQKPAVASSDLGSRIDIIIPSRWAMAFWKALLMRSPLVGGLRETKLVVFESLGPYVPDINDPDTPAYTREAWIRREKLMNKYLSRLSDQKVNFIKLGIRNPFFCDWKNLTKDWSGDKNFYVLRHLRLLTLLKTEINIVTRSESTVQKSEFNFYDFNGYLNCLVRVKLSMVRNEGMPKEFAIICMPTSEDLRSFENNENYDGPVEKCHPVAKESLETCRAPTQLKRLSRHKVERKKTLYKRRKNKILPQKLDAIHDEISREKFLKRRQIILRRVREWSKLNLTKSKDVRRFCDRQVMGYVTMGGYSFLRKENIGIGFVTLPSLLDIILLKSNIVLVRNTNEQQYRFARLEILLDINYAL